MFMSAHDEHHHRRNQGSRQQVRREHGERHGFRQRDEEELRHSGKKEHRHKHDADAKRRYQRGNGNLLRAIENGLLHLLAHGEIALDIFNFYRRIVHQDADG